MGYNWAMKKNEKITFTNVVTLLNNSSHRELLFLQISQ